MKRKIIPLLTLALLFSVAACGNNNSSSEQGSSEPSSSEVVSSSETVSSSGCLGIVELCKNKKLM